jgi:hypothetical protein
LGIYSKECVIEGMNLIKVQYICVWKYNNVTPLYKNGEQEGKAGPVLGVSTSGRGKDIRKRHRRVNMVEIFCTHVCKWKNETY